MRPLFILVLASGIFMLGGLYELRAQGQGPRAPNLGMVQPDVKKDARNFLRAEPAPGAPAPRVGSSEHPFSHRVAPFQG